MESDCEEIVDDPMEIDETIPNTSQIIERKSRDSLEDSPVITVDLNKMSPKNKDPVDIVVLDDDDEEPPKKDSTNATPVVEIIDLVENNLTSNRCLNPNCTNSNTSEYISAPDFCLSFFRVKRSKVVKEEICSDCYLIAVKNFDRLSGALVEGKPVLSVNFPVINETLRIDDSSDEETEENEDDTDFIDDENFNFIRDNIDKIFYDTVKRYNLDKQLDKEDEFVLKKMDDVDHELIQLTRQTEGIRKLLDGMQIELYNTLHPTLKFEPPISIIDDEQVRNNMFLEMAKQPTRKSKRQVKPVSYVELDDVGYSNSPKPNDSQSDVAQRIEIADKGSIYRPNPKVEEMYYIARENSVGPWIRARVKEIIPANHKFNGIFYEKESYRMLELKQLIERIVPSNKMAYTEPYPKILPCGARVIASFRSGSPLSGETVSRNYPFYAGVVGEIPSEANRNRYLIFFDIGYSQYVDRAKVHLILETTKNVWDDVPVDARDFIKKYFESPDRAVVKLSIGQSIKVEYNSKWYDCKVLNVDCSLVQVKYEAILREEWIYRGSSRLNPLYKEEMAARMRNTRKSNEPQALVQYEKNKDVQPSAQKNNVRAVARKTTSRTQMNVETGCKPFLPRIDKDKNSQNTGPTSKIMYFTPRDQSINQRKYKKHKCSISCKRYLIHSFTKLRGHNPLSKPLLCGWARLAVKSKNRKEIQYKAPCGRRLRNIIEIHKYLRITKSEMTVDLFDFNHLIRCLAEFSVECAPDPKDLSRGVEQVPIPVINGINSTVLDFCNYSIKRVPMEDVHMNLDPDFLCGCDCDDDCADKTKCSCWKLTLEGAKYLGKDVDPNSIGYYYRRLPEQVITGIYECNSRCKCASTCLNRVVQNPMSLKLQVFRTYNRGWGIRCLNDVPQGSFICIYAGTINTEQQANQNGLLYGDEYFAELDYIEVVEGYKEGYEEEAFEDDDDIKNPMSTKTDEIERFGRRENKKKYSDDNNYVPTINVSSKDSISNIKSRLRNRGEETHTKEDIKPSVKEAIKSHVKTKEENKKSIETLTNDFDTVMIISDDEDEGREVLSFNPKDLDENTNLKYTSVRELYGKDEAVYVMDAKNSGNIGRFLNHCCQPNVFVQNVFVDTHDPRFPWVAFFSSQFIRAGTELTWNYNYDVGSVPGRKLDCNCGAFGCKGRLL